MSSFVKVVKKEVESKKQKETLNLDREKTINPYEKRRLERLEKLKKSKK